MAEFEESEEEVSTLCDRDIENNVWVDGVVDVAKGLRGVCLLDTMTQEQFIYVIQRTPQARLDLPKVTSNAELLDTLARTPLLPTTTERTPQGTKYVPYYSQFRGQPVKASK